MPRICTARLALALGLLTATPLTAGCSTDVVVTDAAEQEAREAPKFTPLGTCTVEEAADATEKLFNQDLDTVLAAHPEITVITDANRNELTEIGSMHYLDLGSAIEDIMAADGLTQATPDQLRSRVRAWVLPLIETDDKGNAVWESGPLITYRAIEIANQQNAFARSKDPAGVDIEQLFNQWQEVTDGTNLDEAFLLPVKVNKTPTTKEVRKYFHGAYVSDTVYGKAAIEAFWQAGEGPEGSDAFAPIAKALGKASIKKLWYFYASDDDGDPWSRNYLIVLDEHKQLWGFMMGYSE